MFENIPQELREFDSWVVWRLEESDTGKPTKVPYQLNGYPASPTNREHWSSFKSVVAACLVHPDKWTGIGFVLSDADPFAFIDLDEPKNPDGSPLEQSEYDTRMRDQHTIFDNFNSYAELSPSGKGLHIIIKGSLLSGRKRSSVEIYSSERFMTMTGNVYRNVPIADYNVLANELWAQMGKGKNAELFYAGLEYAQFTDDKIIEMACTASNGQKFGELYFNGNWQQFYPSQSEADFAVINILAFYSKNRSQVHKLFLKSKLAERDKSRATYRINYMLNRCFDNLLPPVDFEGLRNQVNEAIEKNRIREQIEQTVTHQAIEIDHGKSYLNLSKPEELHVDEKSPYQVPAGLLGMIASYIYSQAPLPVPEIALAAAIGLMSGVVGKAYNISATGLNQYTLLLAATGTGKESGASGIAKLMTEVIKIVPAAGDFIGPSEIASPQALTKYLANQSPSMISIVGEFGLYLQQMGSERASPHMVGLKRMLLDLYNKSGDGNKLGKMIYSDTEKNTNVVIAPSFSIFGESVPERFYEALTENMISEGLLPRFTIIEYFGDRVTRNKGASLVRPSQELVQMMATLCANSLNLMSQKKVINVQYQPEAEKVLSEFEDLVNRNIYGSMELKRQLWNRAHMKALRLAATVAVGENPFDPVINVAAAKWAIGIVLADVKNLLSRFEAGEVGVNNDENKQLTLITKLVKKWVVSNWHDVEKTAGEKNKALHAERIIPYAFLQRNTSTAAPFKMDKMGATNALKRTLKILVDRGDLQQMARADLMKRFSTGAESYAISSPSAFGL